MAVAYHGYIIMGVQPRGNFATLPTAECLDLLSALRFAMLVNEITDNCRGTNRRSVIAAWIQKMCD